MTLVDGWNHDADSANGAGKSSVLSAITWCLFGKLPRSVTSSSVVREGEKSVSVRLTASRLGKSMEVHRSRSPNTLTVSVDGGDTAPVDQEQLDAIVGISYERFLQICYFAQGLGQRFLDLSDTERKQLFLELSRSFDYAVAKQKLDLKLKDALKLRDSQELTAAKLAAGIQELSDVDSNVDELETLLQANSVARNKFMDRINELSAQDSEPDLTRHRDLLAKLKAKLSQIHETKGELRALHSSLARESRPLSLVVPSNCPHCSGSLLVEGDSIVACDEEAIKNANASMLEKQLKAQSNIKAEILRLDAIVAKESAIVQAIEACEAEMSDMRDLSRKTRSEIESLSSQLRSIDVSSETISKQLANAKKAKERLRSLVSEEEVVAKELLETKENISVLESAVHVLGPSGIQAYVLDSVVDSFNQAVSDILSQAWPNMLYELLTFKENKSGAISTRFSDRVTVGGRQFSIGALSGGERKCLSIAIDLALSRVFFSHVGESFGPLMLDEPFDHMDSTNRERAISLLQPFSSEIPIIVVDHANEVKGLFDNIINIEKKNNISYIGV